MSEFPKMLYKGDEHTIVPSKEEQADAEKQGWHEFGKEPKRRGRPPKVNKDADEA